MQNPARVKLPILDSSLDRGAAPGAQRDVSRPVSGGASGLRALVNKAWPLARFAAARATGRRFPLMVTMSLTDKCNFHCDYCDLPVMDRGEMSTADWHRAIDELADAGMMRVSLMGGEPLLRKDIGELIDHLKARQVNVAMNTNGWLVPNRIEEIAKLDLVCITLDGTREVHDGQRHPGSHDKVLTAIKAAQARGVKVVTMTVLTPRSVNTVDYVLEVAREHGIKAFFQLEHDREGDPNKVIGNNVSDSTVTALAEHLLRRKSEGWPVGPSRTYLQEMKGHGYDGARRLHSCEDCHASRYFLSITPTGQVVPCPLTFRQKEPLDGRTLGFAKAFEMLKQPTDAGCGCYPTNEMTYVLDFRVEAIWNALEINP
jgi:MoaA/NifB/PqqE/SkfB family radical SAM enzyme